MNIWEQFKQRRALIRKGGVPARNYLAMNDKEKLLVDNLAHDIKTNIVTVQAARDKLQQWRKEHNGNGPWLSSVTWRMKNRHIP